MTIGEPLCYLTNGVRRAAKSNIVSKCEQIDWSIVWLISSLVSTQPNWWFFRHFKKRNTFRQIRSKVSGRTDCSIADPHSNAWNHSFSLICLKESSVVVSFYLHLLNISALELCLNSNKSLSYNVCSDCFAVRATAAEPKWPYLIPCPVFTCRGKICVWLF